MEEIVANFTLNNETIEADFDISDAPEMDAVFKINAAGTTWGSISGEIENQTDLSNALNSKADASIVSALSETVTQNTTNIATINATLTTFGDIVTHDVDEFATATQGELADTALQPNDNISELINDAGYITNSALNGYATETWVENKGYITGIDNADVVNALGYTPQEELIAGNNVQINGNTISATDTIYYAGDNVTISNNTISAKDTTYTAGNGININGNTIATSTTIAKKTDIGNANLTIYGNSTLLGTFSANATTATTVTVPIPTTATEVGALPSDTTIEDLTTESQQAALDSGATAVNISAISTNTSAISNINSLIPNTATTANQLATEGFVNSSIATNTANFIGTFNSVAELEAYSGTLTNNDYAFVATTDSAGNTLYDRYKYTTAMNPASWVFEYELNNSSFTSDQWAAINSGVTASSVSAIAANTSAISGKQDALTAGDNITISNGTISATDTTYSAGANITIQNGTISATDTTYSAGNNISIVGGTISATYTAGSNVSITNGTISATDTTYTQGNGISISGGTISTDTTIASKTDIGNGVLTIQRNGSDIGSFSANATSASTINLSVPTTATEVGALPSDTVIGDGATIYQKNGTAFATATANQTSTVTVNYTIPTTASDIGAVPDTRTINGHTLNADVTLTASDVSALPSSTTIGAGNTTITVNGTVAGTINANATNDGNISITTGSGLPSQTGNSGKYLTTDGTDASWANTFKYLPDYSAGVSVSEGTYTPTSNGVVVLMAIASSSCQLTFRLGSDSSGEMIGVQATYGNNATLSTVYIPVTANETYFSSYYVGSGYNKTSIKMTFYPYKGTV